MPRRIMDGRVVSDKMEKTVVVEVVTTKRHPLYHKVMRMQKRFMAHGEAGTCRIGDPVRIEESRPLSRNKRWRVIEVLQRASI